MWFFQAGYDLKSMGGFFGIWAAFVVHDRA
jgi:hypothetical protein